MTNGPRSIGVIMDGNRRWAKEQGLETLFGHQKGAEKIHELLEWAQEAQIEHVILYAFSTENWNRTQAEVSYLMVLFEEYFKKWMEHAREKSIRIRFIGDHTLASEKIQQIIQTVEETTKEGRNGTLTVAFSYGGRAEILAAVNKLLNDGKTEVSEEEFSSALWTSEIPDPDLILRTGGEQRLSNFLPWQSVYSELFFTNTKWPALTKEEFFSILEEYRGRERRRGK